MNSGYIRTVSEVLTAASTGGKALDLSENVVLPPRLHVEIDLGAYSSTQGPPRQPAARWTTIGLEEEHPMVQFESGVEDCIASWRGKMEELPQDYSFCIVARFDVPESENTDDYLPRLKPFFDDVEKTGEYQALYFRPNLNVALDLNKKSVGSLKLLQTWDQAELEMLPAEAKLYGEDYLDEDYLQGRGAPEVVASVGCSPGKTFAVGVLRLSKESK